MFKKIVIAFVAILVLFGVGLSVYCWRLSEQIEDRFSARRWSIPSKVFSDTTLLYPGQRIERNLFQQKLQNLGYRFVDKTPDSKGEVQ
ncbi:MAG: hypothetical protein PVH58_12465, partial [Desulfobacterales bacterium]